jgi:hypothetical protein
MALPPGHVSDGMKAGISGTNGNDDIAAVSNDADGTRLFGNQGNDVLRGGKYNDVLVGGQGDDEMAGGGGADIFAFYGLETLSSGARPTGNETDKIRDLNFAEGDMLAFASFAEASANAVIKSYDDLVDLVNNSHWSASEKKGNGNLTITYDFGEGVVQNIVLTAAVGSEMTAKAAYIAAGGTFGPAETWGGDDSMEVGVLNV